MQLTKFLFSSATAPIAISIAIASCGGQMKPPSENPMSSSSENQAETSDTLLSELSFSDPSLRQCIQDSEATRVSELKNLKCLDIQDTSGLEQLKYLNELSISIVGDQNHLSLHALKELKSLAIISANISQIDISANEELELVHLYEVPLENIDLSHNAQLKTLRLHYAPIETIDLSFNSNLEELIVFDTSILELDLSSLTKLTHLDFASSDFTSIDLSHNPELITLGLRHSKLATVDLSAQSKLEKLLLTNGQITELDLSNNTELNSVILHGNPIDCDSVAANLVWLKDDVEIEFNKCDQFK